jgi:hypothetical protein
VWWWLRRAREAASGLLLTYELGEHLSTLVSWLLA